MKKKFLTTLIACTLVLSAILFVGCSKEEDQADIVNPIEVTMSITYPKGSNLKSIKDAKFKAEENSTVSDALQLYCNVSNIPTNMDTTSGNVTGIASVQNGNINKNYTWKFKVNGIDSDKMPSEVVLKDGDTIDWVYIK